MLGKMEAGGYSAENIASTKQYIQRLADYELQARADAAKGVEFQGEYQRELERYWKDERRRQEDARINAAAWLDYAGDRQDHLLQERLRVANSTVDNYLDRLGQVGHSGEDLYTRVAILDSAIEIADRNPWVADSPLPLPDGKTITFGEHVRQQREETARMPRVGEHMGAEGSFLGNLGQALGSVFAAAFGKPSDGTRAQIAEGGPAFLRASEPTVEKAGGAVNLVGPWLQAGAAQSVDPDGRYVQEILAQGNHRLEFGRS